MNKKKIISLTLMTLLLTSFSYNKVEAKVTVNRLSGANRYETMKAISENHSSDKIDTVIIASGQNFPDALSAGLLSKKFNAPIILLSNNNTKEAFDYIEKHLNNSGQVILLGGTGSISADIENTLYTKGYDVVRLGGIDRFDTNSKIVAYGKIPTGTPIIVANGLAFPDALSVSSISGIKGYPVLLTSKDSLDKTTIEQIKNISPSKIYIIGGSGAVSDTVKDKLLSITGLTSDAVVRVYGSNRYDTSLNIAKTFDLTTDTVVLANGENFPDALSGSALAIKLNSPIILTNGRDIKKQKEFIDNKKFTNSVLLGGYGAISKQIEDYLATDILTPTLSEILPGVNFPGKKPALGIPGENNRNLSIDDGWVLPVLKSTSTDNLEEDAKILAKELEFYQLGSTMSAYSPYGDMVNTYWPTYIGTASPETYWNSVSFQGYYIPVYDSWSTKNDYINVQLLKFYFPTQWKNIHDKIMKDTLKFGDRFVWDGRQVFVRKVDNFISLEFSKVGGKIYE